MLVNQSFKSSKIIYQVRESTLTALGISLGWVPDFLDKTETVSSSDDESPSSPIAEGSLLATLKYVRKGGVPLPAKDLADLKIAEHCTYFKESSTQES